MSVRRKDESKAQVQALQKELEELKSRAQEATRADNIAATMSEGETPSAAFDALTPVEQSAASLGVHPDAWKPIGFMNNAHYETLKKSNALDDTLARRIEAYRSVAESSA